MGLAASADDRVSLVMKAFRFRADSPYNPRYTAE